MKKWKLGIVGCGGAMFCIHLPVLQKYSDRFEICAVCDFEDNRLEIASQRIKGVRTHRKLETLLEEKIDLVAILSPNHEEIIEKVLAADKHVFTEKPISLNVDYSERLKDLARSKGLLLEVGLMRLYDKVVRDFFTIMPPNDILSITLNKMDGSDNCFRRSLLPTSLETYSSSLRSSPIVPNNLSKKQLSVLKTLLWSGTHLLTTLCQEFEEIYPISCSCSQDVSSIASIFETPNKKQFTFSISDTEVPLYIEEIKCVSKNSVGRLEFSSPYILGGTTRFYVEGQQNIEKTYNFESSFFSMWDHISHVLEYGDRKSFSSLDLAIKVENFARKVAELCV